MSRLRPVPLAEANEEVAKIYREFFDDRDPVAQPGTSTGSPGDYWTTFALVPDLLTLSHKTLMTVLQPGRQLPAQLRELAILRTGIVGDCRFEYSQHLKVARMVNLPEAKLAAVKGWKTSDQFTAVERVVMAATDELISQNRIEDETFAALHTHLSDPQIFELVFVVALYRMHGLIVRALHLEYDKDTTGRMQEVPIPTGLSGPSLPKAGQG